MTRQEFIAVIAPIAVQLRREGSPILPSVRISQAMLETGCVLHTWNNLVGYKVGSGQPNGFWKGASVSTKTWEVYDGVRVDGVQANWRAYDCIEDCFRDQDILFQWSRYERVRDALTAQEQTNALYLCGYATDPVYAQKLNSFISSFELNQYDKEVDEPMLDKGVAETIINTWISPAWIETKDQEHKDYLHWLANELRKASRQQVE
ncbi:glycoside hydrolase family 73 protein [Paenibacillus radicis (ex Xue et al. 2023)]|uniref:Glucosaminidase domain-containing protein n=1 Tax=Paenibacillus radicis (ex Xue et al. 2023) TaxID=2972489 RepID=A0ABT1YRD9_9BACL|nr:glucosaminidase domain-containing protein [Paenibacillus radicis (ex Xue et al. 2023)]MCR8635736.1 glucosaminidase domain-containing protein [Paenibacillus radicis (ex Xue et al. 2023)]